MIESLFGDKTCSWVRIVNFNKSLTEMSEETHVESVGERSTGKLVAKARPRQTSNSTLSLVSIPYCERKWIDVEVSKSTTRLLRHDDSINREEVGSVKCQDPASIFRSEFTSSSHCSIRTRLSFLRRGGGIKKRFQYCVDPSSLFYALEQFKPSLEENIDLTLPDDFAEHIYHVGSSHDLHSIIRSGLIPGGKSVKKGRHAVFFTAVNPICTKKSSTT